MSNLGGLVIVALAIFAAICVGASGLSIGACLFGMKSRQAIVRRWVVLVFTAVVSIPLAAASAYGCHLLAGLGGMSFEMETGYYFAAGGAAATGLVAGFTIGRLLSRASRQAEPEL